MSSPCRSIDLIGNGASLRDREELGATLCVPGVCDELGVAAAGTELALCVAEGDGGVGESFADCFFFEGQSVLSNGKRGKGRGKG